MLNLLRKRIRGNGNGGGSEEQVEPTNGEQVGISITCVDCGLPFAFTANEQKFFADKGLSMPKRCPSCRKWRKFMARHPDLQEGGELR